MRLTPEQDGALAFCNGADWRANPWPLFSRSNLAWLFGWTMSDRLKYAKR